MSAIDFRTSVKRKEDPKGDRVVITMDGKVSWDNDEMSGKSGVSFNRKLVWTDVMHALHPSFCHTLLWAKVKRGPGTIVETPYESMRLMLRK